MASVPWLQACTLTQWVSGWMEPEGQESDWMDREDAGGLLGRSGVGIWLDGARGTVGGGMRVRLVVQL